MHNNGWKMEKVCISLNATQTNPVEVDCIYSCKTANDPRCFISMIIYGGLLTIEAVLRYRRDKTLGRTGELFILKILCLNFFSQRAPVVTGRC